MWMGPGILTGGRKFTPGRPVLYTRHPFTSALVGEASGRRMGNWTLHKTDGAMDRTATGVRRVVLGAMLAVACAGNFGCQLWNNWLDMLKLPTGKKNNAAALPGDANQAKDLQALPARMLVYRISLPVGTFSGNDKVWSQLNEDAMDSKTTVLLAQNGLRAGVGPTAKWGDISKLIDVPGAETQQMVCETDGRSTVNVITRSGIADQIVVSVDRDLEQQGRTFNRCDDGFRLSMRKTRVNQKGGAAVPQLVVQLEPVVTEGTSGVARGLSGTSPIGGNTFTSEESFADLQMAATLSPNEFFVVAPQDPRGSRFSVGSLWLSDLEKAPPAETILVFVPAAGGAVAKK